MHKKAYSTWKHRPVAMGLFLLSMWVFLPRMVLAQLMQVEQVSQPTGFVSDTQVVEVGNEFTTLLPDLSSNGYIFGYWKMGEERLADGQGRSVVQPTVEVSAAITLTAHYFLETEDTDGDGVRDWFEWRNFGTLYQGQQDDADGDGFTNWQEDALGQEPTIFDEVEDGGIPARRSATFVYADTSMVKYTMKSDPLGFVDTTERFVEINGTTTSANLHGESNGYTFAFWSVNGVRQAAGAGVAVSQVTTRVEDTTVAIAHYLPTTEDSDGDGVADWFELNQFGDLNSGPQDDADGDSFTNAQEEALGQEATILDEVEDGGVTARRSPAFVYADTSMVAYLIKSDPLGFVDQTAGFVEQNASVTTPSQHGESNGYTFAYWSVDGVRQVSPNGLSLSQVTVAINAPATLVAHYLPTTEDSDGDGVEDWFEIYQFGDLGQSPDDDMDGDGFSNRQENELGQEALIIDEVEDGGVPARRSKSVLYYQQQNYAPSGLDLNKTITFTNLPADTLVGGLTPTDLNDAHLEDNYTYSLLTGSGGDDYAQYSLSGNLLNTANLFADEANHSLLIRVTDSEGLSFDKNFTIQVLDPALDPDGDGLTNQQEWIAGTRHDHSDTDGDGFSDSAEITAGTNPLDAEDFPNAAPTDLNSTDVLTVAENQPAGTLVGEFNATDPDGDIIVYSLVNGQGDTDNDFFLLDENGTLTTASVLDYEAGDVRTIRVQASDPHGASIQGVFTVQVTNDVTDDVEATFTVSGGQHQAPFFTFTDHNGDTPDFSTLHLKKGAIYEFISSNISGGHTFMIGGSYGDTSSEHVSDNVLNSYQNGQKLTLTIPSDFSGELYYFCTYHSHMVQPFLIGRPTHTVDLNSTVNLEMIWVEPDTFTMGSPTTEEGRSDNETQHEVTLTKGFYLGKYEVTQAQYEAVMETAPIDTVRSPDQLTDLELWLDANHSSASSGTWQDRSSKGNHAVRGGSPSSTVSTHNGLPVMSYTANGQRHKFPMITNIRTVFWVISQDVSVNGSGFRYLLSDSTKHPHWHNQNNGKFWSSNGWTHNYIKDGVTRMNGSKINGITTDYPNNLSIISVRTTGDVHADNFGYGRGITDRQWIGNLGELVIFSKALSDSEIEKVEGYLAQKWGLISNLSISHSYNPNRNSSPSMFEGNPNRPVEQVSWDDVQIFLKRLNEQETDNLPTGWSYVLPTEAEWEYACRAGTRTAYSWGDDINSSFANYNIGQTSNVGNYAANPWGFFDMHGNVLEWVSDDLGTQDIHSHRGVRGGAYSSSANYIRSARRAHADPSVRRAWIGFRLAFRQITEPPINLNSVAELTVFENQPIGTIVGEFNATDPDGESRYEIISGVEMSWQEAREDALSRGGHLVTITSQEENNIITSLLESAGYPDDGPYWVGMHEVGQGGSSAGQFQWVTGEAIDYTNWQASHPEYNGGTRAVYVTTINTNNLGKWYDWRDDPTSKCNGYMLELPPVVSYHLVAGEGDGNNSLFTLDTNGTLRTATVFNYETNASTYTIRVQAKDELNASAEEDFTVTIYDVYEGPPNMWDNGTDLGNGWKNISWFGNFNGFNSSWWIYHDALGWSFGAGVSLSHFWLYHTELGWLWTGTGIYPYLYSSDQGTWLYIDNKDGNAMYFNVSSSQWVTFSDGGPGAGIYPQTWDSNRFYDVGDLVWSGGETFIATVGSNNQEPPNTNYWTNLIEVHQALGLPVEDLPTLDTTTILSSLSDLNPPETSRPTDLNSTDPLTISKNQIVGSIVGQFSATDPNGGVVTYQFVNGDNNNSLFSLDVNGTLRTASTFLNHSSSSIYTIKVRAKNDDNAFVENTFEVILTDILENLPPRDLNTTEPLSFSENLPIGTIVGEFNATDPDGDILTYHFVSGDNNNSLFTLDQNGTLRTAVMFDFESNASSYTINVKVSDGKGGEVQGVFEIELLDLGVEEFNLDVASFVSDGEAGRIGQLSVQNQAGLSFLPGRDGVGNFHHFAVDEFGTLTLAEELNTGGVHEISIQIFREDVLVKEEVISIQVSPVELEDFLNANTSDSAYHESALMIRELKVVQEDNRNGHNPISSIAKKPNTEGLFVTTAQPHGRKVGDSVVLSGVQGLQIEGLRNWNFMVDEVTEKSFRIRHFGKGEDGNYSGELGQLAKAVAGTEYIGHKKDYLLGAWTFGHLLGNMVGEQDDPVTFYKHFVDQWNHNQVVNGWDSGIRKISRFTALNDPNLTLANLPFRLLAIGNRLDLFHAKSIRQVDDAGEGRFVFTNVSSFDVPENEESIWKIHEVSTDEPPFTLIFEYGQPTSNFAELSSWAKDWHKLEVKALDGRGNFTPTQQYLSLLNDLTDRFTKRGAHPIKPNGNPINQVRTNEVFGGVWQMREFNLLPKADAENVKSSADRTTKLTVNTDLNVTGPGLWTTTTKNNPMIGNRAVDSSIVSSLARWINKREHHILDGAVGVPAPSWMEGPVANQPGGFSYSKDFGFSGARINLARYKYSLSTCSGCHNGDTGAFFQMVKSRGKTNKAFFDAFMVGNKKGGPHTQADGENLNEKHEFFDLQGREVIVRDILNIAEQVDAARLRLSRVEFDRNELNVLAKVFVQGGVIGDWEYELPVGQFENDQFRVDNVGNLSFQDLDALPDVGYNQIFVRAKATDGTGVVLERPYALWVLGPGESRQTQDLDTSIQPGTPPPMTTPRPNRTH